MNQEAVIVKGTNAVALFGITLPAWWPSLLDASETAAALVPILSALWLIIQIYRNLFRKPKHGYEDE